MTKYSIDMLKEVSFIETELSKKEIEDIAVGLIFYIEEYTFFGNEIALGAVSIVGFLCRFYGCTVSDENDFNKENAIHLYNARLSRCGLDYKKYIDKILEHTEDKYIRVIEDYFSKEKPTDKLEKVLREEFPWIEGIIEKEIDPIVQKCEAI